MRIKSYVIVIFLIFLTNYSYSQIDEPTLGKDKIQSTAAFYDISDPLGVNIEVNLWGFVKYPGRYKIPYNSTLLDLLSFSGGPVENSDLREIRILRPGNDSLKTKSKIIKIDYNDFLWEENISQNSIKNPVLESGDVILVKQERRYTLRDNLLIVLPIVSSIVSIATLIVTITRK